MNLRLREIWLGLWILTVLLAAFAFRSTYNRVGGAFERGDETCEGIGFGCTLGPHDQAALGAWVILGIGLLLATISIAAVAAKRRGRRAGTA